MNRIERITYYENILNEATRVLDDLEAAYERYEAVQAKIAELEKYYTSATWRKDFEASEAGKLPEDLPCGVLSEDGIYNVLVRNKESEEILKVL